MITEDYVSFELAKLLKEKGFPQNPNICNTAYTFSGKLSNNAKSFVHNYAEFDKLGIKPLSYSMTPTLQMTMKWLRKVHKIIISFNASFVNSIEQHFNWNIRINSLKSLNDEEHFEPIYINTKSEVFEEACEAAIKYCLENLI